MEYVKTLVLAAMVATAVMAAVGANSAFATTLTNNKKEDLPVGTKIVAVSETEKPTITGGFKNVVCNESTVSGKVEKGGSATETVSDAVTALTLTGECTCEVVIIALGNLEFHGVAGSANGTLTSTGTKVTVFCEKTLFGPVHCIYTTNKTDLGTLTGSSTTGGTATMEITAELPREKTDTLCAEEGLFHAKYLVTTPDFLDVS